MTSPETNGGRLPVQDPREIAKLSVFFFGVALFFIGISTSDADRGTFLLAVAIASAAGILVSAAFGPTVRRIDSRGAGRRGAATILLSVPLIAALSREAPPWVFGTVLAAIMTLAAFSWIWPLRRS